MKRGTFRIISILLVLILLFATMASAGLLMDVVNRFSLGSLSMVTGFGIFDIFQFSGWPIIAHTDSQPTGDDHTFVDMSCHTNEDCFGKPFVGALGAERCRLFDEYSDDQHLINRMGNERELVFPSCVCDRSTSFCAKRLFTATTPAVSKQLIICTADADCQGKTEKCTSEPGQTAKYCKEPDCTQASDCEGKFPRSYWNSGLIQRNQPCDQDAEFPQKCYCGKSNWCMTRDTTFQCANADVCGIGETCTNGKCVAALNLQLASSKMKANLAGLSPSTPSGCRRSSDCEGEQVCENGACKLPASKEARAKALYDELVAKLNNLEERSIVLEETNSITGAAAADSVTKPSDLAITPIIRNQIAIRPQLSPNIAPEVLNTPYTLSWFKNSAMPVIDGRMIDLESRLCALAQAAGALDYNGLTLYDGENVCEGLSSSVTSLRPEIAVKPSFFQNIMLKIPFLSARKVAESPIPPEPLQEMDVIGREVVR